MVLALAALWSQLISGHFIRAKKNWHNEASNGLEWGGQGSRFSQHNRLEMDSQEQAQIMDEIDLLTAETTDAEA